MDWKQLIVRKLLVVAILSLGIMPFILIHAFSKQFIGYTTGMVLSGALILLFGMPSSILSEVLSLKFKKLISDYHPSLITMVCACTYISLNGCFSFLIIILGVLVDPLILLAIGITTSVLYAAILFSLIDLIIYAIQSKLRSDKISA